ncbi:histidine kinase [Derxia gummosa]|uniref:histidine kinase n=1 Tax=Derxia gummosa DSM 723 TaxID=1121388 RepID=A0A8B6X8I0_9BURK|nr:histidine kinase [Derxia gummosa]
MSLRLRIQLVITALTLAFAAALLVQQVQDTRRSVHEEIETSSRVTAQLLARVSWVYEQAGLPGMVGFLERLGRVRATEIELRDAGGKPLYASPPSPYKAGRDAPAWYARMVAPSIETREIEFAGGKMFVHADSSRAVLDGWDDLLRTLALVAGGLAGANLLAVWIAWRITRQLQVVMDGLRAMEGGDYRTRLPELPGREGRLMSHAFNAMARAVEDNEAQRLAAAEARARLDENRALAHGTERRIEEERAAIARELHDELGQQITAVRSLALVLEKRVGTDADSAAAAKLIGETAAQMYTSVHELIPRLRPLALDRFGLVDALGDLVDDLRLANPGIGFEFGAAPLPDTLPGEVATAGYRIAQEALANAVRHAGASQIALTVRVEADSATPEGDACGAAPDALCIDISDDGAGLASDARQRPGHWGLLGMRERAEALGGRLLIASCEGAGTRIGARLPLDVCAASGGGFAAGVTRDAPPAVTASAGLPPAGTGADPAV